MKCMPLHVAVKGKRKKKVKVKIAIVEGIRIGYDCVDFYDCGYCGWTEKSWLCELQSIISLE